MEDLKMETIEQFSFIFTVFQKHFGHFRRFNGLETNFREFPLAIPIGV